MEPKRLLKPRIEPVDMSETDGEARSMLELIAERNNGQVFNIFATLARYPKLLKRWLVFANQSGLQALWHMVGFFERVKP